MRPRIAFDPYVEAEEAELYGAKLVDLDTLLSRADFVSLHCPLSVQTRGMIGAPQLARMRPDAYLINTARGGIVDEDALLDALRDHRIAGAALDCYRDEPVLEYARWSQLDNVLLAPHSIGWTDELFRDMGTAACRRLVDLARGHAGQGGLVNPEVLERPSFQRKWNQLKIP